MPLLNITHKEAERTYCLSPTMQYLPCLFYTLACQSYLHDTPAWVQKHSTDSYLTSIGRQAAAAAAAAAAASMAPLQPPNGGSGQNPPRRAATPLAIGQSPYAKKGEPGNGSSYARPSKSLMGL